MKNFIIKGASFAALAIIAGMLFEIAATGFNFSEGKAAEVDIPGGATRLEVASIIGEALGWDRHTEGVFASTYAQMQWAEFNKEVENIYIEKYKINNQERQALLTNSVKYLNSQFDFLSTVHIPGVYAVPSGASQAQVAELLISRVQDEAGSSLSKFITESMDSEAAGRVLAFIRGEHELLPDLVPLPPRDLVVQNIGDNLILSFSTIYYNQGEGPLELRADPSTTFVPGDVERRVFQRIYREDGTYRDKQSGTFLWHAPHLHYHFADFIIYDLEAVDAPGALDLSGVQEKSTFCIRDVSRVSLALKYAPSDAEYRVCGRERQGISVGWGDTYFYTYPDQNLNITNLPSGTYRLSFIVNPEDRFEELTKYNNTSSIIFALDMENLTVKILEKTPKNAPKVEHVYEKQEFI